ncbi:DUF3097 family protein, partial [Micromonospora humida]|uniref:DUF3097 family protein n=1 Tax=Micromonospora humida TaxID=2809018 RepID=UPI00344756E3
MAGRYGEDVLAGDWRRRKVTPEVDAEPDLVVEDADSGFCGAVVGFEAARSCCSVASRESASSSRSSSC